MNSFKSGMRFETKVKLIFTRFGFNVMDNTGGSKKGPDVSILHNSKHVTFECKTKNSFEGGGKCMNVVDDKLTTGPETFFNNILNDFVPWGGKIPSFKNGDKSFERWMNERHVFRDEYVTIPPDSVSQYYYMNNVNYMIIEKKGIYHTGKDPMGIGCPLFTCDCKMRIRCKRHSSSSMPTSVQMSLVFNTKKLKKWKRVL